MRYLREKFFFPPSCEQHYLSSTTINCPTFSTARVKQGGYSILTEGFWGERTRERHFAVLVMTLSGTGRFTLEDGTTIAVHPGQAFISASQGQGHREETIGKEPWETLWLTVWEDSPRLQSFELADWQVVPFTWDPELKDLLMGMLNEESYNDINSLGAIELFAQLFFIYLERALGWTESTSVRTNRMRMAPLWKKVTEHIDRPWPVEDLCKEAGISRSHLSRFCEELYNKSPGRIVRDLKMKQAKLLLCNSDYSVGEIADHVGYLNAANFTTAFTHVTGLSPRQYRQQYRMKIGDNNIEIQ